MAKKVKRKTKTKRKTVKKRKTTTTRKRKTATARKQKSASSSRTRRKPPASRTNGEASGQQAPAPAGNTTLGPGGIRVRMYRVGFGDFFLLSLQTAAGPKHILIDCGVHHCDAGSIKQAVADMAAATGHELSLVIMTHRHADHISGFATCKDVFAQFTVGEVWMSWFEDKDNQVAMKFQTSLKAVAERMQLALAARARDEDDDFFAMAENATGAGAANTVALNVLHGGFKNKADVKYYRAGDTPTLPKDLADAGLLAKVLGPPEDLDLVSQMSSKNEQYLAASENSLSDPVQPFMPNFSVRGRDYTPPDIPNYNRKEIERSVMESQPDLLAAKAKQADNTLNNQSLVVLFTYKGKNLLFAGDAQWGNWENFLYGGRFGAPGHTALTQESKSILSSLDFYKVGHHGSTNATPKDALKAMRDGLVAMCSTQPGCFGKEANGAEVPRGPLLEAIEEKTHHQFARSDQVKAGREDATEGIEALSKPFTTPGDLYIDYNL